MQNARRRCDHVGDVVDQVVVIISSLILKLVRTNGKLCARFLPQTYWFKMYFIKPILCIFSVWPVFL